ncbi:amidohydrolase family protein [Mesorhizobium sp. CAU 1741]|uniref:amidohydrolase family protein n=1 Tax=Mesorhizobium sp. CAU 1741 TaxID=3140366 RepID=UPI00325AA06F
MRMIAATPGDLDVILGNVRVPASLVADAAAFGGRRDGDCLAGNLVIRGGKIAGLTDAPADVDTGGRLVTMPFVEPHCHLDKCFTGNRLDSPARTLAEAIAAQSKDKRHWTRDDLRTRAQRGLEELHAAGAQIVRTHVDWDVEPSDPERLPTAWRVLEELREEWRGRIAIQRSALLPIEVMADETYTNIVARLIAASGCVMGAFVHGQPDRRAGIRNMVNAAARHGIALDFHVDEGLCDSLDGLEIIAEEVAAAGHAGPVLCGHACNLASLTSDARRNRIELVARAGLSVVSLPTSNLYLQDRGGDMPRLRGLTSVRELMEAGVNTVFGTDNVQDAFCPLGVHSPAAALSLAVLAAQLPPPVSYWLPTVMTDAARALGCDMAPVDRSDASGLLLWQTSDPAALLSDGRGRWQSIAGFVSAATS